MFGIVLGVVSSALLEVAASIGKYEVKKHLATYYSVAALNLLAGSIFFIAFALFNQSFVFSSASLPTFIPRVILEIILAHITIRALVVADRGDFALVKMLTVPLLLGVDLALGYMLSLVQIAGIALVVGTVLFLIAVRRRKIKALTLLVTSAVLAVATISLFKYNITHFNSVEAEQVFVHLVLMAYFVVRALMVRENPFALLSQRIFDVQTGASGLAHVAASFAYLYAPAVVITSAMRGCTVVFAITSGKLYFHERGLRIKLIALLGILLGLALLIFG